MKGTGVSSGIAVGKAFIMKSISDIRDLNSGESAAFIRSEINKYDLAVCESVKELRQILDDGDVSLLSEERETLHEQLKYLDDHRLREDVVKLIQDHQHSAIDALIMAGRNQNSVHSAVEEEISSIYSAVIQDINKRILKHLNSIPKLDISVIAERTILIANEFSGEDAGKLDFSKIAGIVIRLGDPSGTLSKLAQINGVPAIVDCGEALDLVKNYDMVIIDGSSGVMLINPDRSNLKEFQKLRSDNLKMSEALEALFNGT